MTFTKLITPYDTLEDHEFHDLINELSFVFLQKALSFVDCDKITGDLPFDDLRHFLTKEKSNNTLLRPEITLPIYYDSFSVPGRLTQILLASYCLGFENSWSVEFDSSQSLLFAGQILNVKNVITLDSKANGLIISCDGKRSEYVKLGSIICNVAQYDLVSTALLNLGTTKSFQHAQFWHDCKYYDENDYTNISITIKETRHLFDSMGATYQNWYWRPLSCVLPLGWGQNGKVRLSGSSPLVAGVSGFSFPIDPYELGEAIVHETAHQYFNIIDKIIKLVDPNDDQVFKSAIIENAPRGLRLMFAAYHAIVNMALYRHSLLKRGLGDEERNVFALDEHLALLESYEKSFLKAKNMTNQGKTFWHIQRKLIEAL